MHTYRTQATFYRAALFLGLIPGESVVRWALGILHTHSAPPHAIVEVSSTAPDDLSGLRHALQPVSEALETAPVVRALLGLVQRDLASGRRTLGDTVEVLEQLRRGVVVPEKIYWEIDALADEHLLMSAGMRGDTDTVDARVRGWLEQFAGAEQVDWLSAA